MHLFYDIRVSKGLLVLSAAPKHAPHSFKSAPPPSELNHVAQPAVQQSSSASMYIPESGTEAAEGYRLEEGLVYVPDITILFLAYLASSYI
ncbi:hypothetical protein glysoja_047325 [Glycine soja]|uniref:Uncharacterized protein n=1 Tax=Glycine soja TaxID=3848 RepID=A0A0B2Q8U9_GLYSO|nr:hypothetical protein glysoja_047325 [Glycine soja]